MGISKKSWCKKGCVIIIKLKLPSYVVNQLHTKWVKEELHSWKDYETFVQQQSLVYSPTVHFVSELKKDEIDFY